MEFVLKVIDGEIRRAQVVTGVVALSGRDVRAQMSKATYATAVAAGGISTITITPATGYIGRVKNIGAHVPLIAGAPVGNHSVTVYVGTRFSYAAERIVSISAAGTAVVSVLGNDQATQAALKDVPFSVANPLSLDYTNSTDLAQTGLRFVQIIWEEEKIV